MKKNGMDGNETKGTNPSLMATESESFKRAWQTPEIIEEDYRETEAGIAFNADGPGFSYS